MTIHVEWTDAAERGLELFNNRQFYECHDVWEEIWMTKAAGERTYYQGLIQIAVGLYKIEVGNHSGARSLLRKGIAKLESVPDADGPLDISRLLVDTRRALAAVETLGQARLGELDRELIPTIHRLPPPGGQAGVAD